MSSTDSTVAFDLTDGVATLRINRPEARNAINAAAMTDLRALLDQTAADDAVRCVVLTGTGKVFSAGADLKDAAAGSEGSFAAAGPEAMAALLAAIVEHPKPTIAAVQGDVFGGGNGLVAACDLSVAADGVRFAFSEVRLGLTPAVIAVVCLPKMKRADAMELFLFGERVSADRVRRAGLINAVVAPESLQQQLDEWTGLLGKGGPLALSGCKDLINMVPGMSRPEAIEFTAELSGTFFRSEEAAEGIGAFLQKRPPRWAQ